MNPYLASLYGTGQEKLASEGGDLDLSDVTEDDIIAALESGDITEDDLYEAGLLVDDETGGEKVAGDEDEIDLNELSVEELRDLVDHIESLEAEQEKVAQEELLSNMSADGSFDYFDTAGRIVAHALNDELSKMASAEDAAAGDDLPGEIEVDLDDLSAADLEELQSLGYEFAEEDDGEKVAGMGAKLRDVLTARKLRTGARMHARGSRSMGKGKRLQEFAASRNAGTRAGAKAQRAANRAAGARISEGKARRKAGRRLMLRGAAETGTAYGALAGGVGMAAKGRGRQDS